jgi:GntR family transcriptional regulator/MocR family aminotransferase
MLWINIDKSAEISLTRQIYEELRAKILGKELIAGEKLPSTRKLARELAVSRNTILEVYEQLIAEGYLESSEGSGTYVTKGSSLERNINYYTYDMGANILKEKKAEAPHPVDFISGTPDLSLFPRILWAKCLKEACLDVPQESLNYTSSAGIYDLRVSMAKLLLRTKGIKCHPSQIIITSGSSEAFLILSKLLGGKNKEAIIEDPAYNGIKKILQTLNIKLYTVPADDRGMKVDLIPRTKKACFIIVTPSHHFPLGSVLPIQRRIKLVEFSRKNGIYIIENDYDSEFRYLGYPISSLQLLDPQNVIHIGTFSESMYPGIRLGYMILPENLVRDCKRIKGALGLLKSSVKQIALSYFIKKGNFERHLNKMKKVYQKKREFLLDNLQESFGEKVRISGDSTGLYVVAEFAGLDFTLELVEKIENQGIVIYPVEDHALNKGSHKNKIILGYGNLKTEEISEGVSRLKKGLSGLI